MSHVNSVFYLLKLDQPCHVSNLIETLNSQLTFENVFSP